MHVLFAQAQKGPGAGGADAGFLMGIMCFYGVVIAVVLVIQIFFLLSLSRCLQQVAPRNRRIEPGQVWLNLIPLFNIVWLILTILRTAESLQNEYEDRDLRGDGDYGKTAGLVYYIGSLVCGPVGLVGFIMYWMKIAGYTRELREAGGGYGDYDDEYEDDRPRKKKKRRDEYEDDDYDDDRRRSHRDWR